ncbi:MAG: adenylate/guanylate cyclase domain-containing protein [Elusimicrobiota bacterium]
MIQLVSSGDYSFLWRSEPQLWVLREGDRGQRAVPVRETPFVLGRAWDCQLMLPSSADWKEQISRWHCHVLERDGEHVLHDGSLRDVPEIGRRKPSISGTFHNGRRLPEPVALKAGDTIAVGPWRFRVETIEPAAVHIDEFLKDIAQQTPRPIKAERREAISGFGKLHRLFEQLNRSRGTDESLVAILKFAMDNIRSARVAAVLVDAPRAEVNVRMAWRRDAGRIFDFRFSTGLVRKLPPDEAFLLEAQIADSTESQVEEKISSGLLVPLRGEKKRMGILYMDNRGHGGSFTEEDLYLADALASVVSMHLTLERQAYLSRVEQNMRQYFGPEVVQMIVHESQVGEPVGIGVTERMATILFVDMQGFSAFCRDRSPREVSTLLNPYFQLMTECIQRHEGHVDKFIGDAVMGVFGTHPLKHGVSPGAHALQAVRSAREMIREWTKGEKTPWGRTIPIRIGINTGAVVVGNIGFPGRMEYTALGDPVNLAARVEKYARPNGIVVTDETYRLVGETFPRAGGQRAQVKGFGTVEVHHLEDPLKPRP